MLKTARAGSELKQWICIYFLLLLTHLLRGRTFVTCSVFPAPRRLSLSRFLHSLQPVCVGHTRSLLHPLNSQGLSQGLRPLYPLECFFKKLQQTQSPTTQRRGGRGHPLPRERRKERAAHPGLQGKPPRVTPRRTNPPCWPEEPR